jgi:pyruvate formate-lyase activating enzyme-like uncharacterized protein
MKILSIQEAYKRKFERQRNIKKLEYHAAGHCVHIGKLSPGCEQCFTPINSLNLSCGPKCNLNCPYCPTNKNESHKTRIQDLKFKMLRDSGFPNFYIQKISFTGGGETLMYINIISKYMKLFHDFERYMKKRPWYYLYTNGILADIDTILKLKDLGFDEIRFHLGASNFSKKVYKNMMSAVSHFKAVTVETPAWPPHRKKLFEMLPIIEDIGVKHLNIGEIEIKQLNYKNISQILPDAEVYQCFEMHLYDGGLVYDIIEEVLRKNYSYSVLDCNCFVKSIQRAPGKQVYHQDVKGLCAEYKL